MEVSILQKARYAYKPKLPAIFSQGAVNVTLGKATEAAADTEDIKALFRYTYGKPIAVFDHNNIAPANRTLNVGLILSGGQAPGGHNVISGLYDGLKQANPESKLYGFIGGPSGLIDNKAFELTDERIDAYRNTGGFDMIGSGRTKIETPEQFASSLDTVKKLGINAVVIIGGDDSNTNAALLAEYFLGKGSNCQVIGCPKTIDGDLKNNYIEASFGFDTAAKTYSELIGNIERDANSARKYWHFIKLMGRSASHITLECALQTQPNVCLISEEIAAKKWSLGNVVDIICDSIVKRAAQKHNFGVVLVPEGLVEFIPEMKTLISELNDIIAIHANEFSKIKNFTEQIYFLSRHISPESAVVLKTLPAEIAKQLLVDRDPHGNVQVSRIETEKLLISMVETKLIELEVDGTYKGKFSALPHFFGYEGRCAFPSNFDADYCYSLGYTAFVLINAGLTGYIASVQNLTAPAVEWIPVGIPLTMLMNMEQRHGHKKPVIRKALVDLSAKPFKTFESQRAEWAVRTDYLFPGAIQYYGPVEVCDQTTKTLQLEYSKE
ncbi:pyrophosphate--fructose 6-phosphate 1-phosphotransferase [Spirochaetia bacterium]|nr:pyrophosphate--fructose 6-phosphate 1-phosphotransferase [Spirochaetia bacterium]